MYYTVFSKCIPDLNARQCENCKSIVSDPSGICRCGGEYRYLRPIWFFFLKIDPDKSEMEEFPKLTVQAIGTTLDPIMGMSIEETLFIQEKIPDLNMHQLTSKYFVGLGFCIPPITGRYLQAISLPKGTVLTFKQWMLVQYEVAEVLKINEDTIISLLLNRVYEADDDDNIFDDEI